MKYKLPIPNTEDRIHTIIRAGLGTLPLVGAAAAELFNAIVAPPLDLRRQRWMEQIGEALATLEETKRRKLESLQADDVFLDTVLQASQAAIRTSTARKLDALRNAVLNAALPNSPEASLQHVFISFVDTLSEWHLLILAFFAEHGVVVHYYDDKKEAKEVLQKTIEGFFPKLVGKEYFYMQILRDLAIKGLVPDQPQEDGNRVIYGQVTDFGQQFLSFIRDPR